MRRLLTLLLAAFIGSAVAAGFRYLFPAQASAATPAVDAQAQRASEADVAAPPAPQPTPEPVHPTGWAMRAGRISVMMSDGTVRLADHGWTGGVSDPISQATASHVVIDGERLFIRPRVRPAAPLSAAFGQTSTEGTQSAPLPVPAAVRRASAWREDSDGVLRLVGKGTPGVSTYRP